jgi:hypothetical protein
MYSFSKSIIIALWLSMASMCFAGEGKLLETAGVSSIEGSGGGGLVPWALIAGYDTPSQTAASVFMTRAAFGHYQLNVFGAQAGISDRVEISIAKQTFKLKDIPLGQAEINQNIYGLKVRLWGNAVYSAWPQISAGLQYKQLQNAKVAKALGATNSNHGVDLYLAASKVNLGGLFGYNFFWNLTIRATKANQFGLLGYGGDKHNRYQLKAEASVATFIKRQWAIGAEFRQKPDNLSSFKEQNAWDVFSAYIPNKHFNITLAWVELGTVVGAANQSGPYVSINGYLW